MSAARLLVALALLAAAAIAQAGEAPAPAPSTAPAAAPAPGAATAPAADDSATIQPTLGDDRDVLEASDKWMKLIDAGQYGAAWDLGAKVLKDAVTRPNWNKGIAEARKPFGKVAQRKQERFARAHELPGAPAGDYAIIEFTTSFTNGKRAVEQLTWMLEPNGGIWRVSGYYIR